MKTTIRVFLIALFFSSCSSAYVVSTWMPEKRMAALSIKKIMVIGLINEKDISVREKMEKHLVGDLKTQGYEAQGALELYGAKAFEGMSELQVLDALKKQQTDAILMVTLLDKTKEQLMDAEAKYLPRQPYAARYNNFRNYYATYAQRIKQPVSNTMNTKYIFETSFYGVDNEQIVYASQSEAFLPENVEQMAHQFGKAIVQHMLKKKVLTTIK